MRGRRPSKGQSRPFQVRIPQHHFDYLTYLARHSRLGATESEVAAFVLVREIDEMLASGYHEKQIPTD